MRLPATYSIPIIFAALVSAQPNVTINIGSINGEQCPSTNSSRYLGIPYAQPPVGSLRFAAPQPYNGTYPGGTFNATKTPATCLPFSQGYINPSPTSEDCLVLNVFTPAGAGPDSKLPVKFYIYGGSFLDGSIADPLLDGCNIASDAIVVSVNYRVGPLGFLAAPSAGIPGNMGISDQILGLEWVQDNIAAFGGDPKKVLLFGESAGAISTWILAGLPDATKWMSSAICESGAGIPTLTQSAGTQLGAQIVQNLNCSASDGACIKSKQYSDLLSSLPASSGLSLANLLNTFGPYVDGNVIPENPSNVAAKVPVIYGTNADEGTFFISPIVNPTTFANASYSAVVSSLFKTDAASILSAYPLSAFTYAPNPAFEALSQLYTDVVFKCPTYGALALADSKGIPAYSYRFNTIPSCIPAAGVRYPGLTDAQDGQYFRAYHTSEIPFVWGDVDHESLYPNGTCSFTSAEKSISQVFINSWTNMASQQYPAGGKGGVDGQWPRWNTSDSLGLVFGNQTTVGTVDYSKCLVLEPIVNQLLGISNSSSTNASSTSSGSSTATHTGGSTPSSTSSTTPSSNGVDMRRVNVWALGAIMVFMLLLL
ncbi:alpha/beta-hydrolase [Microthyrium microscopicum]|uniref:Carboxylic ester hydrolase n=1 Tax=Microthyrium microscopicum TaxID=703497 RepID=A0A6A6U9Z0_9PEZI|nr:alpha/beta-hydrolase [Microthyrium microscopicum]